MRFYVARGDAAKRYRFRHRPYQAAGDDARRPVFECRLYRRFDQI